MQDLTEAPTPDTSDPSGTAKDFAKYAIAAGMAGAGFTLGSRFIGQPIEGLANSAVNLVSNQAEEAGNDVSDIWGGV